MKSPKATKPMASQKPDRKPQLTPEDFIAMCRVKGVHFDVGGTKSTYQELVALGGLFEHKDIKDRLNQPDSRMRNWMEDCSWVNVFYHLDLSGKGYTTTYIHLDEFNKHILARLTVGAKLSQRDRESGEGE